MNEILKKITFDGFNYPVTELTKYVRAGEIFTIMLKDRSIIHHSINLIKADLFEEWLTVHKVFNITPEKGSGKY
ncbi:MAG TPA: hypothetical protein VGB63_18655 [Pedobacter sp.]|jgi:hypothetical protein